ncbi:ribosomal protein S7A [Mitosporidium daphniae]|uniref:40S ribosomal protein S7 n=1 Tax=Mitosporidium daphniae TaxID=1485682 RepID=A0A098VS08_9MICR|nr:40S ribosomal protein S7 [Mitosporidium daphniae]KGG51782.1 40S ribosomal protein S7 [Mitosporidium daphniae]|eukprot:XP_013238209.1 40S ribosomal protein S7 [Mitosporidium daphniae]
MSSKLADLARTKIMKPTSAVVSPVEMKLAECFVDLESHNADLRAELRSFRFYSVNEVDCTATSGRRALVVYVPVSQLAAFRRISSKVVTELEKKFSDKHIMFVGRRKIETKAKRTAPLAKQNRLYSRTLTSVHEKILDDLVSPFEIVGKRTRFNRDGSRVMKVLLDPKDRHAVEAKIETMASVYGRLTGKAIVFEFPTNMIIS